MIHITLPDGSVKEYAKNSTPMDVAMSISHGLARNVISASFNGATVETKTPLTTDGNLTLYTFDQAEGKKSFLAFFCPCHGAGDTKIISRGQTYHWSCY